MEISDIKASLSIETVLAHYGVKTDKNHRALCPFHADKTPSLQVYPKTNTFCCFSTNCQAGTGDVIQFIELKESCTKHEALLKAKELLGYTPKGKPNTEILTKLFSTFSGGLKQCKPALEYLQQRNLELSPNISYNGGRFHMYNRLTEDEIQSCVHLGLLKPYYQKQGKQLYQVWAKDCVVFPLKDQQNKIVSLYGRSILGKENASHFYLPNRKGLYPNYPSKEMKKLILTESIIDAETLLQSEITKEYSVLALYGTNGLTEEHSRAIQNLEQLQEIILFFDGDQAGVKAVEKYSKELQLKQGLIISQVKTPDGEDVNSLLDGHSSEILTELLNNREALTTVKTPSIFSIEVESLDTQIQSDENKKERQGTLDCTNPEKFQYENPELQITVWGGIELDNLTRLRVSLFVQSKSDKYLTYRDDVNLYSHSSSQKTVRQIAETLELPTTTIGRALHELTEGLEQYRMEQRAERIQQSKPKPYEMSEQEKQAAPW